MKVTDADRVFGGCIADIAAGADASENGTLLRWMSDAAARKAKPEKCSELLSELHEILAPVLVQAAQPDDTIRVRCAEAYLTWLASV